MKGLSSFDWVALILTLVGGLNWGLIGFFGYNLVGSFLGGIAGAETVVYGLVGLSSLYLVLISKSLSRK